MRGLERPSRWHQMASDGRLWHEMFVARIPIWSCIINHLWLMTERVEGFASATWTAYAHLASAPGEFRLGKAIEVKWL